MPIPSIKVGDTIYYRNEFGGRLYNKAIVALETSRSWIVTGDGASQYERSDPARYGIKLAKNGKGWFLGSERDAKLALWAAQEQHNVVSLFEAIAMTNAPLFLQVAKLIGYEKLPEAPSAQVILDYNKEELRKILASDNGSTGEEYLRQRSSNYIAAIKRGRELAYDAGADGSLKTVKEYIDTLRGGA